MSSSVDDLPLAPPGRVGAGRAERAATADGPAAAAAELSLSVVVCTCADAGLTLRCVRSLLRSRQPPAEVVVVDNRPHGSLVQSSLEHVFGADGRVRHVAEPRRGLAHARNAGLALAEGEIVAFVDDDIVVDEGWAQALREAFADDVGCVTGLLLPLSLNEPVELLFERFAGFGKGFERRRFSMSDAASDRLFPYAAGSFGSGANTAVRRSVANRLDGFDVRLGAGTAAAGGEDLDMYVRLLLAGETIVYEPAAVARHEHPSDAEGLRRRVFSYGVGLTAMLTKQFLHGPRLPILRGAPAGLRYVFNPRSRKNAARGQGYPRRLAALELLGMLAGPVAYLRSAGAARGALEPHEPPPAAPVAMCMTDLEHGLADRDLGRSADGRPYGSARMLLRLHGEPIALVEMAASAGRVPAAVQASAIEAAAGEALARHAERCEHCAEPAAGGRRQDGPQARSGTRQELPFVSVIVPTAGRPERVRACLAGLTSLRYPRFEIVIVDNAPKDGRTRAVLESAAVLDERCRYIAEPLPGSSVARNRGVREARGELLAFTDDDVHVDPDWLTRLVEPFLEDSRVGVVTGLVMPARLDTPSQLWFEELSGFGKGFERRVFDRDENRAEERLLYPYWGAVFGSGNSMAFRPQVLREIGGFDPALGAGSLALAGADIESFSHAIINGHRLVYEPRAICWHDHRADAAAVQRQIYSYGVGLTAILTKWLLRDPRLSPMLAGTAIGLVRARLRRRSDPEAVPQELRRLNKQLRVNRRQNTLGLQIRGYAIGPLLYVRSVAWSRRLRLHRVIDGAGQR